MGRGRSKVSSTASAGPLSERIKRAKTLDKAIELAYGYANVTKDVTSKIKNQDHIKNALAEMTWVKEEFPNLYGMQTTLDVTDGQKNAVMASMSDRSSIVFTGGYVDNQAKINMERRYDIDVNTGFHPAGTTFANTATHEMGHQLVRTLTVNATDFHYNSGYYGNDSYLQEAMAKKIVQVSAKRMKSSMKLRGATDAFRRDISGYATYSYGETVAEALADYRANGKRAKPLSQHIFKTLKAVDPVSDRGQIGEFFDYGDMSKAVKWRRRVLGE